MASEVSNLLSHLTFYNRKGEKISLDEYLESQVNWEENYLVARNNFPPSRIRISTVLLGIDHNWHGGIPLIFETMIFGGLWDELCWRYPTEKLALAGHNYLKPFVEINAEIQNKYCPEVDENE